LNSTLHALNNRKFICSDCVSQFKGNGAEEKLEMRQAQMACKKDFGSTLHKVQINDDTFGYSKCVGNYFSHSALQWIEAHQLYDKGILPFPGGFMDQPNKAVEAMRVVQGFKIEQLRRDQARNNFKSSVAKGNRGNG